MPGAGRRGRFIEPPNLSDARTSPPGRAAFFFLFLFLFLFLFGGILWESFEGRARPRLGLPVVPVLVLVADLRGRGPGDEDFRDSAGTAGSEEKSRVRIDLGGDDVRRDGKALREQRRRKRSREVGEERHRRLGPGEVQPAIVV